MNNFNVHKHLSSIFLFGFSIKTLQALFLQRPMIKVLYRQISVQLTDKTIKNFN
jgi:hypothetical protein